MKKKYIVLISIGIILLVAILTNPNQDVHKQKVKSKFNEFYQKTLSEQSSTNNKFAAVSQAFATTMMNTLIDNSVKSDNYIIFSLTKFTLKDETKIIGIGAFGNVFLSSKIDKALDK